LLVRKLRRRRTRYNHHVNISAEFVAVSAICLAKVAFDTVAPDGAPHFARYGISELPALTFPPDHMANEVAPHPLSTFCIGPLEVGFPGKALSPRILLSARHCKPIPCFYQHLNSQTLPAFPPASSDYGTTSNGRHSNKKTVIPFSFCIGRLKRSFHVDILT